MFSTDLSKELNTKKFPQKYLQYETDQNDPPRLYFKSTAVTVFFFPTYEQLLCKMRTLLSDGEYPEKYIPMNSIT